jgi:hypothetical protein
MADGEQPARIGRGLFDDQMAAATLRFWRHKGTGPKSFKVGRRLMYREEDVAAWLEAQYAAVTEFDGAGSAQ